MSNAKPITVRYLPANAHLHEPLDDFVNRSLRENFDCGRSHVPLGGQRQEIRRYGLIACGLRVDDEVICSDGEIAGLNLNAKFFAQLPCGSSALRRFLDIPNALVGEVAEKHVLGHGSPPFDKA